MSLSVNTVLLSVSRHMTIHVTRKPITYTLNWVEVADPAANGCALGEGCRCKSYDAGYRADCWNWTGKVSL